MDKLQSIYNQSPIFLQELLLNIYGIKSYLQRYTGKYKQFKKEYLLENIESVENLHTITQNRLREFLLYVCEHSSYYNGCLKNLNLNEFTLDDLSKLPYLEKEDLRKNIEQIISTTYAGAKSLFINVFMLCIMTIAHTYSISTHAGEHKYNTPGHA